MTAVQLSNVSPTLLPPTITGPIFLKASETSAVMQLARKVPLSVSATTEIPVPMDVPVAGWVSEGGPKPVAAGGVGVKKMVGKKVALLVPVSEEVVLSNPAGLYDQLQQDLPTAIGRAFDYAAIHGLDLKTGSAGPFSDFLAATPNAVVLGTTTGADGGAYVDLVTGIQDVVNSSYDFTGFAGDPRLKPELMLSVDGNGQPLLSAGAYGNNNTGSNMDTLIGYPAAYNSGVSGAYRRSGDLVQIVTETGTPTGGTFTLTIGGVTTGAIAQAATTTVVQTAVNAILPANITCAVTGTAGTTYTLTFTVGPGPVTATSSLTGGTTPKITVAKSPSIDSGLRAIGGDWSQCAYGVGMDISIKVSSQASYTPDGGSTWISAFQNNLTLLLVEAYYGFVVGDVNAFVAYSAS